jgi:UDP-N-acetylmuramyl tripeptide synthase
VILALAPGAIEALSTDRDVTLVSGTNGKTTTTAMLAAALRTQGAVTTNANGANTPAGLTAALAASDASLAVLETDEGWLPRTVSEAHPRTAVLLNLSRDQLHRHHEVKKLVRAWRDATDALDMIVANADDPDVVWPAMAAKKQVWVACGQRWIQDAIVCPRCGGPCTRTGTAWGCECGLRRPTPDWWLEGDYLVSRTTRVRLSIPLPGLANLANAAMAVATAAHHGVDPKVAAEAVATIDTVAGRYAVFEHEGREARLLLAKNPAGWLEALSMLRPDTPLALVFNSDGVDGRDPSWLYDVSFDSLQDRPVAVAGRRATDMLVRLRMAGLDDAESYPTLRDALRALPTGPVDVLANYTAFQDARRELGGAH